MKTSTKAKIYIILVVILSLFALVLLPRFGVVNDGPSLPKSYLAVKHIENIAGIIAVYRNVTGDYPSNLEKLREEFFIDDEGEKMYYLYGSSLDPWGNEYNYVILENNEGFQLTCFGADGLPGGEGLESDYSKVFFF